MTVDVNVNDDPQQKSNFASSPLGKRYCKCHDQIEDVRRLAENCMIHQCNNYCLQSNKTNALRTCWVHFGTESAFGKMDTQGLPRMPRSRIITDKKGISHFWMTCTESVRVVQRSIILLRSWRANRDIKLLLYYSDPSCPDISKIEDVCRYVVAYTGKRHNTTQSEKDAIQNIILEWVQSQTHWQNIQILNILFMTTIHNENPTVQKIISVTFCPLVPAWATTIHKFQGFKAGFDYLTQQKEARLGILIFGSNFWDPHRRQNSDSVYNSKDSCRIFFLKFRFLESQKIGIPICDFWNSGNFLHRNSVHLFVANLYWLQSMYNNLILLIHKLVAPLKC